MYNNETDLQELYEQIEASQPKSHINLKDRQLRRLMRREKANIVRLKQKMKEQKAKEGEQPSEVGQSEEPLNEMASGDERQRIPQQDENREFGEYQYMGTPGAELTETATVQKSSEEAKPTGSPPKTYESQRVEKREINVRGSNESDILPGQQLLQNSTLKESTQKYHLQKEEMKQNQNGKEEYPIKTVTTVKVAQDSEDEDRKALDDEDRRIIYAVNREHEEQVAAQMDQQLASGQVHAPEARSGQASGQVDAALSQNPGAFSHDPTFQGVTTLNERALADLEKEAELHGLGIPGFNETHAFSGPGNAGQYHTSYFPQTTPDDQQAQLSPGQAKITSPKRLYIVGKFKEYRKLVGKEQVKFHTGDPDLNMSQKRRKTLSMSVAPPTQELTLTKTNKRGALINEAIQEIIFNLEKYDKKQIDEAQEQVMEETNDQSAMQQYGSSAGATTRNHPMHGKTEGSDGKQNSNIDALPGRVRGTGSPTSINTMQGRNQGAVNHFQTQQSSQGPGKTQHTIQGKGAFGARLTNNETFLPRLAKQKVLDKFMDLSTADVFNRTAALPLGRVMPGVPMNHTQHVNAQNMGRKEWSQFNTSQLGSAQKAMMAFGSGGSSPSLYGAAHSSAMQRQHNRQPQFPGTKYGSQALSDGRPSFIQNVKSKLERMNKEGRLVDMQSNGQNEKHRRASQPSQDKHMVSIKYARGSSLPQTSKHDDKRMDRAHTSASRGEEGEAGAMARHSLQNQTELTLSLPQMGPSFNFYKFRGTHEAYKAKFREYQRELKQVDDVLQSKWGETMNQFNKYGIRAGDSSVDEHGYLDGHPIGVDNKGISPLTQSPRDKDFMSSKDAIDFQQSHNNMQTSNDISILQRTMDLLEQQHNPQRVQDLKSDQGGRLGAHDYGQDQHGYKDRDVSPKTKQKYGQGRQTRDPNEPDRYDYQYRSHLKGDARTGRSKTTRDGAPQKGTYVPKFVREAKEQRKGIQQSQFRSISNWHGGNNESEVFAEFYQDTLQRFGGDKEKTMQHIENLRRNGALQQILQANKFDLKEMITDRKQFIKQLNGQFGGANVNDLISMQLDEFKVRV